MLLGARVAQIDRGPAAETEHAGICLPKEVYTLGCLDHASPKLSSTCQSSRLHCKSPMFCAASGRPSDGAAPLLQTNKDESSGRICYVARKSRMFPFPRGSWLTFPGLVTTAGAWDPGLLSSLPGLMGKSLPHSVPCFPIWPGWEASPGHDPEAVLLSLPSCLPWFPVPSAQSQVTHWWVLLFPSVGSLASVFLLE